MRRYASLAVFIFGALLGAQQASDESPGKAAIAGKVVDAVSGEPLKKAIVIAHTMESRGTPFMASSDAEGKFAFPDLDAGRYQLSVERNAYARQQYGQRDPNRPGSPLTLKAGQKMTDVLFRMIPAAVITGRIIDEDNEPVANAQVSAVQFRYF